MHQPNLHSPLFGGLVLSCLLAAAVPARAAGVKIGDDQTHVKLALLLQSWASFSEAGAPDGESLDVDLYLRRMRILLFGQLNDKVRFFVETDSPKFGKQGDLSVATFIQDAWLEFNLHAALQVDVGMLLAPFSHHGMQGAVSLHSLDYHGDLIQYPAGSHKVWRDFGVMVRGLLLDELLEYRLAVLDGVHGSSADPRNPHDWPRLTARVTLNAFESEAGPGTGGFFYDGIYLAERETGITSPKKILSFGASVDWQKDLNAHRAPDGQGDGIGKREDYLALAGDVFFDLPLSQDKRLGLCGQLDFYYYDHGEHPNLASGYTGGFTGYGLLSELGLRYDAYEIVVSLDWFEATEADGDDGDLLAFYGGFNWWWLGHATSIKLQAGGAKRGGGKLGFSGIVQAQLLF